MIQVEVTSHDDGFMNINVKGHAKSNICASVSTLLQSNIRFMQELEIQYPDQIQVKEKDVE